MKTEIAGPVSIRPIADGDHAAAAGLMSELGYPTTPEQMAARMGKIALAAGHVILVAEADGRLLGLAHADVNPSSSHDAPVAHLAAMVVTEDARGLGVGRMLVAAVEDWARGMGSKRIVVTSHLRRAGAHAFYVHLGYDETGKRFVREL